MPKGNPGQKRGLQQPWTKTEEAFLSYVDPAVGTSCTDEEFIARFPTRQRRSILNKRRVMGLTSSTEIDRLRRERAVNPDYVAPVEEDDGPTIDVDDIRRLAELPDDPEEWDAQHALAFADHMAKARQIATGIAPASTDAVHVFDDGLPIAICLLGDFHVGASGVEWFRLKDDLKTIGETDGLYAIGMGDYAEGVSGSMGKLSTALHGLGAFPDRRTQQLAIIEICKQVGPKWLAFAEGNHDGWSDRQAAYNFTYDVARAINAPFFREAGGSVYVTVGQVEYLIAVAHDWHGKSRINPSNKQRRMLEEWRARERPDVVCTGHTHHNLAHQEQKNGMDPVYLNSGTFKTSDRYSTDRKFHPAYGVPMVILYPDERVAVPVYGSQFRSHGLRILAAERAHYRAMKGAA